jgi:hypothetical protein
LRHANAGHDAGRADRSRADADLHGVGAGIDQGLRALAGRHVPGDDLHSVRFPLDAIDRIEDLDLMAVGGVNDDQIGAGVDKHLAPGKAFVAHACRGSDAETSLLVLASVWMHPRLFDVLDGDKADAAIVVINHEQLLDAMRVQEALRFL